jgi:hypothetical protein
MSDSFHVMRLGRRSPSTDNALAEESHLCAYANENAYLGTRYKSGNPAAVVVKVHERQLDFQSYTTFFSLHPSHRSKKATHHGLPLRRTLCCAHLQSQADCLVVYI